MHLSSATLRLLDGTDPAIRQVFYALFEEIDRELGERVTRKDFQELQEGFQELRKDFHALQEVVYQLAQAQQRTEERIERLTARVDQLAQAQQRTEERLNELALAQQRTEKELQTLARSHKDLQRQVGGLAMAVGYGIEDQLMPFIPGFVAREYGIDVRRVDRTIVEYDSGGYDEVNILAAGTDADGNPAYVVGECKAQPGKRDLARFAKLIQRVRTALDGTVHPLLIGYVFDPAVARHAQAAYPDLRLVKTYQIRQIAEAATRK